MNSSYKVRKSVIIIVEDNDIKFNRIQIFLQKQFDVNVKRVSDFTSGFNVISTEKPDYVILDMAFQSIHYEDRLGARVDMAGVDILDLIARQIPNTPVSICTSYSLFNAPEGTLESVEELYEYLKDEYRFLECVVLYNSNNTSWIETLSKNIRKVIPCADR